MEYAQIVEDYREEGKKKTKIIKHLGPVNSEADLISYRKTFALEKRRDHISRADLRGLNISPPKEYGLIYAAQVLCHDLGIDTVFDHMGKYSEIVFLSVVSRIVYPSSDVSLLRILEKVYYPRITDLKKDSIYDALDYIIERKDQIEQEIVSILKPDMRRVYYDLTSTYFEGKEKNDLVLFGYSRDKKRGKRQINIGLCKRRSRFVQNRRFEIDPLYI
ncbi:MAG: hypothetical protein M1595_01785 [Candidatus Thermoplasmatota archaeon]|nr:hypothetical protein [Candidatus Thermoplasmatota archaeon]